MGNLDLYNRYAQPPQDALKSFNNGKFKGTDINPMWRIKALTEEFGPCGAGWYTKVERMWREDCKNGTAAVFCEVSLYVRYDGEWSAPITGIGGNTLERVTDRGNSVSDEAYKMAYTDALGIACKALGIGADIWWKSRDGSKYAAMTEQNDTAKSNLRAFTPPEKNTACTVEKVDPYDFRPEMQQIMSEYGMDRSGFAAMRKALIDGGVCEDKPSAQMTEEDWKHLFKAMRANLGESA